MPGPPLGFAVGGAGRHATPYGWPAVALAVKLGATGIAAPAWQTRDRRVVLAGTARAGTGLRRRPLDRMTAAELDPDTVELGAFLGDPTMSRALVALALVDPEVGVEAIATARDHGAEHRVWLLGDDLAGLARLRPLSTDVVLAHRVRTAERAGGLEPHLAVVARSGIDAVVLDEEHCSGGNVALAHRFGRRVVAEHVEHRRILDRVRRSGADAVCSSDVELLVDALGPAT